MVRDETDTSAEGAMSDIVERLRDWSRQKGTDFWAQDNAATLAEAADEIERLRAERDMWRQENLKSRWALALSR